MKKTLHQWVEPWYELDSEDSSATSLERRLVIIHCGLELGGGVLRGSRVVPRVLRGAVAVGR